MSGLVIDVAGLVGNPGATKEISASEPVPGLRGALGWIEDDQRVRLDVRAESLVEGIQVTGSIRGTMSLACSRCLREYRQRFEQEVDELFSFRPQDDEAYRMTGKVIDLEPMLRDAVVLSIPVNPLHSDECKGLCPACGADRNLDDCGHREDAADMRWEPLKRLLSP